MDHYITLPFTEEDLDRIQQMDVLYLTGTIYTARDAAHKRMYEAAAQVAEEMTETADMSKNTAENSSKPAFQKILDGDAGEGLREKYIEAACSALPFDIKNTVIYYLGPTPARPGQVIGSAGPTTSGRMDKYTPLLLELGLRGMIGKGRRSEAVIETIHRTGAIYMGATGGAGALLSKCIKSAEVIAYDDLGTEAVRKLYVEDFPVTVLIKQ